MKLFGTILLAGIISLFCGLVATLALSAATPCFSDKAGCGLGEAYRLFFVPGYVLLAMIGLGISAAGKNREHALKLTMFVLLLVAFFLVVLAVGSDLSAGRTTSKGDLADAMQATISYSVVVIAQWFLIRRYLRWRELQRAAA
jgi:O-antigen ligase